MTQRSALSLQEIAAFHIVNFRFSTALLPKILKNYITIVHKKCILLVVISLKERPVRYNEKWVENGCKLLNLLYNDQSVEFYLSVLISAFGSWPLWELHILQCPRCVQSYSFLTAINPASMWMMSRRNQKKTIILYDYINYNFSSNNILNGLGYLDSEILSLLDVTCTY